MNTLKQIQENGFAIIVNAIASCHIKSIFTGIEGLFDEPLASLKPPHLSSIDEKYLYLKEHAPKMKSRCYDLIGNLLEIHQASTSDRLLFELKSILGETLILDHMQVRIDDASNDRLLPMHQEIFGQFSPDCITAWIPLKDVRREFGALRVVKGSHKNGEVNHRFIGGYHGIDVDVKDEEITYVEVNAGDAVLFDPLLFHGSSANTQDVIRWTLTLRYNSTRIPYIQNLESPMIIPQVNV